ncbi:MAG: T9SS type A sorting domain-containing protein [bacterium]|nr:T9SS type A sorting domain-containing protein [bacterium]
MCILTIFMVFPDFARCETISVPGDYGAIQVAIYIAESGDTIQVAAGEYTGPLNKNLDLGGKQLVLLGAGPDDSIIDCELNGRGFLLNTGQTSATVVDGFGIINARLPDGEYGGGLLCEGTSPVLRNLRVESCRAEKGGGIAVLGGSPVMGNFSVLDCAAGATYAETCFGGGLYCAQGASPTINQSTFTNCIAEGSLISFGGGIRVEDSSVISMEDVSIIGGRAGRGGGMDIEGGAVSWFGGSLQSCDAWSIFGAGGGLYCREATAMICLSDVEILGNHSLFGSGGGMHFTEMVVGIDITGLNVVGNYSEQGDGGGLYFHDITQSINLSYVNVEGNYCLQGNGGGLLLLGLSSQANLEHLNIWSNECNVGDGAGLYAEGNSIPIALASSFIAYNLIGGAIHATGQNQLDVSCCNVWDNAISDYAGDIADQTGLNGNISSDPLYCDLASSREFVSPYSPLLPVNNSCDIEIGCNTCTVGCDYILEVPTWFDGIQDAIDVAAPGDTIWVLPGTYTGERNKNLSFHGKDLVLLGVGGAEQTIIDCEHDGRGMNFTDGETSAALVQGFTITHGYLEEERGGGIQCFSDPTFRDLIVVDNTAMYSGGISIAYGGSPTLETIKIIGNLATSPGGGGITVSSGSGAILLNCEIVKNTGSRGGGIKLGDSFAELRNVLIEGNHARQRGGGIYVSGSPRIMDCTIRNNTASISGGGVRLGGATAVLENCIITGNHSNYEGGGVTVEMDHGSQLRNVLIAGNSATVGGGVYSENMSASVGPAFTNSTIVDNTAPYGAGVLTEWWAVITMEDCIIASNHVGGGVFTNNYGVLNLVCCDVWGHPAGDYTGDIPDQTGLNGNISLDPWFCDAKAGDYTIADISPCLPEHNDCGVLMGAYEQDCVITAIDGGQPPIAFNLGQNHPNPFNPHTVIDFSLPVESNVTLKIYDTTGRLVTNLVAGELCPAGRHSVTWLGKDDNGQRVASGVYFYRLEAGSFTDARRMILLR